MIWLGPNALMWKGKALPAGSPLPALTPERIKELRAFIGDDPEVEKPKDIEQKPLKHKRGKRQ